MRIGFWAFGLLGFWAFGLLGFWAFGLLGFWLFWFVMSNIQLILHLELSEGNSFKRGVTQID
ncbi:hypothetical protein E1B06_14190 [Brevibacillus laterosporus]|nr:hypothetical protein [Brevibacillus laterosporus]